MDFDEIKQILEMMREHELVEFELERDNVKLRLRKKQEGHWGPAPAVTHGAYAAPSPLQVPTAATAESGPALTAAAEDVEFAIVKSPIVGTFYRSPEPGAKAYADVGETVRKGQVLCIIEAMKLMNEITAEADGEIMKCYVENGQAVQYGERLFAIRPTA